MQEEQVFHPDVLPETPFPGQDVQVIQTIQSTPTGTVVPTTTPAKPFPKKRVATELLSTALNTRSKKILQEFELQQSGGFKIGNFKEGFSGDVQITPNGIVTRDKAGLVTIAMYGEDGSGTFKGSIQSGSVITGRVVVGNNRVIIEVDENDNGSIVVNDGAYDRVLIGYQAGGF